MCLMMQEGPGSWWPLDAEVIMEDGRILATKTKTGHAVLVDCRFEFPAGRLLGVAWCPPSRSRPHNIARRVGFSMLHVFFLAF